MNPLTSKRRWLGFGGVVLLACVVAVVIAWRNSRHPEFGRIYGAEMVEFYEGDWQTRLEKNEATVRRWLHLRQRPPLPQRGMKIGPALLGWSLGGHIYMSDPNSNQAVWEFALSSRTHLKDVTREDLRCEFYGMNDPRGTNVFGPPYQGVFTRTAWEGHAIRVPDGQVFFARLVTNHSAIYVVELGRWQYFTNANGGPNARIRAEYTVVTNPPPRKVSGAERLPASLPNAARQSTRVGCTPSAS